MKLLLRHLALGMLACLVAPSHAADAGPYAMVAVGQTRYDADCGLFSNCSRSQSSNFKLGAGYQFGVFAIEGWAIDWGRSSVYDFYGNGSLRLRSVGLGGAWRMRFGSAWQGVIRAGAAQVQQTRSTESFNHFEGTFGLGISYDVAPAVAVELAYDLTSSTGGSSSIGSVFGQALTAGMRVRF
jgi:opacity protein-like surface antigen